MRSNTPYEYLNRTGELEEVYSPSNPPAMYEHQIRWIWSEDSAQCSCIIRLLSDKSTKYTNLGEVVDDVCRIVLTPDSHSPIYFDLIRGSYFQNTAFVNMNSIYVERNGITTDPIKITAQPGTHMMTFARSNAVTDFVLKRM